MIIPRVLKAIYRNSYELWSRYYKKYNTKTDNIIIFLCHRRKITSTVKNTC